MPEVIPLPQPVWILTVIDEYTRESLAIEVQR
jgi:hypothetical protein